MIIIPPIKGKHFEKDVSYAKFAESLTATGCDVHDLGKCSDGTNNIYGLSFGDLQSKPVLFFEAQIHGAHEWNTAHWMRQFMEIIANPRGTPVAKEIYRLRSKFAFYAIPCLNPYGYENNTYGNANGVNLNRNFGLGFESYDDSEDYAPKGPFAFSESESRIVRDLVLNLKPVAFLDNHTWGDREQGKLHQSGIGYNSYDLTYDDICKSFDFSTGLKTARDQKFERPMAGSWAAAQRSIYGKRILGFTAEVGGGLDKDIQATLGINYQLLFALHAEKVFFENKLTVF